MDETGSGPDQTGENPPVPTEPSFEASTDAVIVAPPAPLAGRKRYVALAVAVLVLLAGGAAAIVARGGDSAGVETKVPADAVAFVKVSLKPSVEQKAALAQLVSRMGSDGRERLESGIDDLLNEMLSESGLTYDDDVRPWIGSQIGIAVRAPGAAGAEPAVVALAVTEDESAARTALEKIKDDEFAFEVAEGIAYMASDSAVIDAFRAEAEKGSVLADSEAFRSARESVGGDGLVLMWADGSRFKDLAAASGVPSEMLNSFAGAQSGVVAVAVRAEEEGIAMVGHQFGSEDAKARAGKPKLLESTSSGLIASVTGFDIGAGIAAALKNAGKAGEAGAAIGTALDAVRESLGIDVERDLIPMLHGEFSVVFGGLSAEGMPDVGILIEPTDAAAATRVLAAIRLRVEGLLEGLGGGGAVEDTPDGFIVGAGDFGVVVRRGSDRIVIALSEPYAATLMGASKSALRDDAVYKRAFKEAGDNTAMQMFVRVDRLRTLLETFLGPEQRPSYETDVAPLLDHVEAFSLRATRSGDEVDFRALLSISGN